MKPKPNGVQHTGIHALMDILVNMPLPDSHKNWKQIILLKIVDQDNFCYEWVIRDGKWMITEGETQEPNLILRGKEIEFLKDFSGFSSPSTLLIQMMPGRGKNRMSFGDSLKFGTLVKNIRKNLKEQSSQLIAEAEQRQSKIIAERKKLHKPEPSMSRDDESITQTPVSPRVARLLTDLESTDVTVRVMAIYQAGPLLINNVQGALEPYLVALSDEDRMVRKAVVLFFENMEEVVLHAALRTGKQADQLMHALEKLPTQSERDDARPALQNISRVKKLL